jgi:hypothetical protein
LRGRVSGLDFGFCPELAVWSPLSRLQVISQALVLVSRPPSGVADVPFGEGSFELWLYHGKAIKGNAPTQRTFHRLFSREDVGLVLLNVPFEVPIRHDSLTQRALRFRRHFQARC